MDKNSKIILFTGIGLCSIIAVFKNKKRIQL